MAGVANFEKSHTGGEDPLALQSQGGAEGLEQGAWRGLRELHPDAPGYYELVASLMAWRQALPWSTAWLFGAYLPASLTSYVPSPAGVLVPFTGRPWDDLTRGTP